MGRSPRTIVLMPQRKAPPLEQGGAERQESLCAQEIKRWRSANSSWRLASSNLLV